jgi:hypothetical protein
MAGFPHEPQQPEVIDISGDSRSWSEVCPDDYMSLEYVGAQQLSLHIIAVRQEKVGDKLKAVLRFSNNPRGLVLNKTNRDTLSKMFGDSPAAAIGKTIVVKMGFVNKNPALVIAQVAAMTASTAGGVSTVAPASVAPASVAPAPAAMTPEMAAMFQQWQAQNGGVKP